MLRMIPGAKEARFSALGSGYAGGEADPSKEPIVDFAYVFRVLRRRLWFIGTIIGFCVVVAVIAFLSTPSVFTAESSVIIDAPRVNPFGEQYVFSGPAQQNPDLESQVEIIKSRYMLAQVVSDLDLNNRPDFMNPPPPPLQAYAASLWSQVVTRFGMPDIFARTAPAPTEAERFEEAVEILSTGLSVDRRGLTYVLAITYSAPTAEIAPEIADAIANTYISDRVDQRMQSADNAATWFDERIAELKTQADDAENQVLAFQDDSQIRQAGREGLLSELQLSTLNDQLTLAGQNTTEAEDRMNIYRAALESNVVPTTLPDALASERFQALRTQYDNVAAQREEFVRQYGETHNAVAALSDELTGLVDSMRTEASSLLMTAVRDYQAASLRQSELVRRMEAASAQSATVSGDQLRLQSLQGEAEVYRSLHNEYLQAYLQTMQQQSFPNPEARLIEAATVPENRESPSFTLSMLAAIMLGTALGTSAAFGIEALDRRVRTPGQLSNAIRLPYLGTLPPPEDTDRRSRSGQQVTFALDRPEAPEKLKGYALAPATAILAPRADMTVTVHRPLSAYSETVRRIKVAIDSQSERPGVVGFISHQPSRGRSILASNYAEMLAVGGPAVLLVDLDWRNPTLSSTLAPNAVSGLGEAIVGTAGDLARRSIWTDQDTGLFFLPNRRMNYAVNLDPTALNIDRLRALLSVLTDEFDHVVLDLSHLSESADASAIADIVGAYVVVADWGVTRTDDLTRDLARSGIPAHKLVGAVIDGAFERQIRRYGE